MAGIVSFQCSHQMTTRIKLAAGHWQANIDPMTLIQIIKSISLFWS